MAKVRLGDIATVVTKGTTPTTIGFRFEDGGINFVKIESISEDGRFLEEKFSHISDECNVQMRRSQLQENDILFSIAGVIGRSAIVTKEILPANTNQALAIIRVPEGKIDYNYLLYALSSSAINQQATQHQQGVAQLNISLKNVSDFLLPIYTEAMQKRIVHNLKKIDKLIFLRKQQLAKLDELVKARFVEMFGELHKTEYSIRTLDELCEVIKDGTHQTPTYVDATEGYKFLSSKDVTSGYIDWSSIKYISEELHQELYKRIAPQHGDILLAKNGTTGIPAIVETDETFDIYVSLALLRLKPNNNVRYIWSALRMPETKAQFDNSLKGVGVPNLHLGEIKKTKVIVPPISLQNQFAAFAERVDQQKQTVQQSLEKLELMKKALMQEYFG